MKRKSTMFAIVAILLTQFLVACGGDTGSNSGSQPTTAATTAAAQPTDTTAAAAGARAEPAVPAAVRQSFHPPFR